MNRNRQPTNAPTGEVRLIRKANELVEARYRYDIWETRIFAHVVSLVRPEDGDFHEYKIYVRDIIRAFGLDEGGKAYRAMVEGAKGLVNKKLFLERERDGKPVELETWLFTSAEYFKDDSDGSHIVVTFHPALKPYLLELKQRYLVYDIRNILRLTSAYSVRMYELLKQYEKIGKRRFEVDDLKLILGILPHEYKLYGHFKDKLLIKAQRDLQAETDIAFEFEEHKLGKKVKSLTFFIHANAATARAAREAAPPKSRRTKNSPIAEKATMLGSPFFEEAHAQTSQWGVAATTLRTLLVEHGEAPVREGIRCTLDNLKKAGGLQNVGGFFVRAVEEGWKSPEQVRSAAAEAKKAAVAAAKKQAADALETWQETLDDLLAARRGEASEAIKSLTQDDAGLAEAAVAAIVSDSFTRAMLETMLGQAIAGLEMNDWRQNRQLRDAVMRQIEKIRPEAFGEIQSRFDEPIRKARKAIEELKKTAAAKE